MKTLAERFWAKVEKTPTCWLWTGAKTKHGYGLVSYGARSRRASRISWYLQHGVLPGAGQCVCHSCDNPSCVNPAHLWLGSQADNMRDMTCKGRHRNTPHSGSENGNSRLTAAWVEQIRFLYGLGYTPTELAAAYAVSRATVRYAAQKGWRHI
jgi:hypothetical protein